MRIENERERIGEALGATVSDSELLSIALHGEASEPVNASQSLLWIARTDRGRANLRLWLPESTPPGTYALRIRDTTPGLRFVHPPADPIGIRVVVRGGRAPGWDQPAEDA